MNVAYGEIGRGTEEYLSIVDCPEGAIKETEKFASLVFMEDLDVSETKDLVLPER